VTGRNPASGLITVKKSGGRPIALSLAASSRILVAPARGA
jgi:hypothetical protein